MNPIFTGRISKGRLEIFRAEDFKEYLSALSGETVEVIVRKPRSQRSLNQNALHWVRMTIIGKDLGYSKEEMHYAFKKAFLADKLPVLSRDQFILYLQEIDKDMVTTRLLSTKEMADFMEKIERQAVELGINLPSPDEISLDKT